MTINWHDVLKSSAAWRNDELDVTYWRTRYDATWRVQRYDVWSTQTNSTLRKDELEIMYLRARHDTFVMPSALPDWIDSLLKMKVMTPFILSLTKFTIWVVRKISKWHQIIMHMSKYMYVPTCKQNNLDVIISAAYIALRSIVLVELLGVQKLSNSFGILLLFQGIASIIGSPIAGKRFICRVVSNHKQHDNVWRFKRNRWPIYYTGWVFS